MAPEASDATPAVPVVADGAAATSAPPATDVSPVDSDGSAGILAAPLAATVPALSVHEADITPVVPGMDEGEEDNTPPVVDEVLLEKFCLYLKSFAGTKPGYVPWLQACVGSPGEFPLSRLSSDLTSKVGWRPVALSTVEHKVKCFFKDSWTACLLSCCCVSFCLSWHDAVRWKFKRAQISNNQIVINA